MARNGTRTGEANSAARWISMVGGMGASLLLGVVIGLAIGRGGPVASLPDRTASAALVGAAAGSPHRLTPPNEHDLGVSATDIPTSGAPTDVAPASPYRLSPPNEQDTEEHAYTAEPTAYRLSPPNEQDPAP
jgi:hypothetical protein